MKISYYWLLENRIVCRVVPAYTTVEDIQESDLPLCTEYFDKSPFEKVHLIIDSRQIIEMPNTLPLSRQRWLRHPKLGHIIAVGNRKPSNQAKGAVAATATSHTIRHMATFTEALKFLQAMDKTLPDLSSLYDNIDNNTLDVS